MPDTIEDRAVVIRMRRRTTGETVAPYRHRRDGPQLRAVAEDLFQWLRGHLDELEQAEPAMPLEDRAADTWEPLIAVADLAGGTWPHRGRRAAEALTADHDGTTPVSDRIRLLADCRTAFGDHDTIPTSVLLDRLKADPEAPWADYGSTGLTAMKLGALLREYDIRSLNIRFRPPTGQVKGYTRSDFTDAWQRYCPPTASQPSRTSPPSSPPGRLRTVGRHQTSPGTTHDVPPTQAVPDLTSQGTTGTAGTATPPSEGAA